MNFDISAKYGPDGSLIVTATERRERRVTSRARRRIRRLDRIMRRELARQFLGKRLTLELRDSVLDVTQRTLGRYQHLFY